MCIIGVMDAKYVPRGQGWHVKGRRPRPVPHELMDMLRHTYEHGDQAVIPTEGATRKEVNEVVALLKRGAQNLGLKLRLQLINNTILFYVEDFPE